MVALLRLLGRPARRNVAFAAAGSVGLALLEVIGILTLLPLLELLTGADADSSAILDAMASVLNINSTDGLIVAAAVLMVSVFFFKGVIAILFRWWILGFVYDEEARTSAALLSYYLRAPYKLHLTRNSSEMIRVMNDAVSISFSNVVVGGVSLVSEGTAILLILMALLVVMPLPTVAFFVYFGLIALGFTALMRNRTARYGRAMNLASLSIYVTAAQALGGVKEVKVRDAQEYFLSGFTKSRSRYAWARRRAAFVNELPKYVLELMFISALAAAIGIIVATSKSSAVLPAVAFVTAAGFRILPSLARLLGSVNAIRVGIPSLSAVVEDLGKAHDFSLEDEKEQAARPREPLRMGDIHIRDLSFNYAEGSFGLRDVNLDIPAGSSAALVGQSGAGKTTLVDVILGLHEPTAGRILMGSVDSRTHLAEWRTSIGLVPQDVFILDDSLASNIAFGEAREDIDETRLSEAIERAQLVDLVKELSDGTQTVLGERGIRLSGGQRQRIGIARALYRRPSMLILDEATSALDSKTESHISTTVDSLHGEVTLIVVAHRLSTVKNCDRVVFMDRGTVVSVGTFDELARDNADFAHLVALGSLDVAGR